MRLALLALTLAACAPLPLRIQVEVRSATILEHCLRSTECSPPQLTDECYAVASTTCTDAGLPSDCWQGQDLLAEWLPAEPSRHGCW